MGDLKGLFQTITEVMPLDKQPELLNKISKGRFSLRDLYEQLGSLTKLPWNARFLRENARNLWMFVDSW